MNEEDRKKVRAMAEGHLSRGEPTAWFEQLYASSGGNAQAIPWADLKPNHNLVQWLDRRVLAPRGKALVTGCGLGDDAEEIARRGWTVTAFDISPTAIDWCRKRFPDSKVNYNVADLLDPPAAWDGTFDFIHESYTLQAVPPDVRDRMMPRLARFLAPGGTLLVICRARDENEEQAELPWPLPKSALDRFVREHGLVERSFEDFLDKEEDPPVRRFRAVYTRSSTI